MAVSVRGSRIPTAWVAAELGSPGDAIAIRAPTRHLSVLTYKEGVEEYQAENPLIRFQCSLVPHPRPADWITVSLPDGWNTLRSHLWSRLIVEPQVRRQLRLAERPIISIQARSADGVIDWMTTATPAVSGRTNLMFSGRTTDIRPDQLFTNFNGLCLLEAESSDPRVGITVSTGTAQELFPADRWRVQVRATGSDRTTAFIATATPPVGEPATVLASLRVE